MIFRGKREQKPLRIIHFLPAILIEETETLFQCTLYSIQYTLSQKNLNLYTKTEPVTARANATVYVWFMGQICYSVCEQMPDIYRCIHSSRDRLAVQYTNKCQKYTVASTPAVTG